jgi:hypothetical protein
MLSPVDFICGGYVPTKPGPGSGIPASMLPAVIQQVTDAFEDLFFWPNVIPSVSYARQLFQRYRPHDGKNGIQSGGTPEWRRLTPGCGRRW